MTDSDRIATALQAVLHPEIKRSLVELGMIRAIDAHEDRIDVTLALPYLDVPVRDEVVDRVQKVAEKALPNRNVHVELLEMSQRERVAFMTGTEGGPRPAQAANRIGSVIAILSGKGGVGKSSVAALLAVALRRQGRDIGVLDADITGPSIPRMFGLHRLPPPVAESIMPAHTASGIKVISINLLLEDEQQAVVWRGPLISRAIKQFWADVLWGRLDYLIVGLPPGTSDASLTVMQSIPLNGTVLVTSPQSLAGMVVTKAACMSRQMKVPIVGLIENMSYLCCPRCGERIEVFGPSEAAQTALTMGVSPLGQLPLDPDIAGCCDSGEIETYNAESFGAVARAVENALLAQMTTDPPSQ